MPGNEILIAQLSELDFESFVENENGLQAYVLKKDVSTQNYADYLADVGILQANNFSIQFTIKEIEQVNWNEEWEKHFNPIDVGGQCTIRAAFHEKPNTTHDILIAPKMAFGTGHHETTYMMVKHLLKMDLTGKKVLDMGCGTGVLAILAEMKGAQAIDAIDIDSWSYENTMENIGLNACSNISVYEGDAQLLEGKSYDLIIANINRNVLLADIPLYSSCLGEKGILLLSGFYEQDMALITERCNENKLFFTNNLERNNWIACKFEKR